ncbi:unnamed protein product, partial [Gulo gulo]
MLCVLEKNIHIISITSVLCTISLSLQIPHLLAICMPGRAVLNSHCEFESFYNPSFYNLSFYF